MYGKYPSSVMLIIQQLEKKVYFYQLAARKAHGRLVLRMLCVFHVCWYNIYIYLWIRTYHVRNNYVTYIVAMQPCLSRLQQSRRVNGCFV